MSNIFFYLCTEQTIMVCFKSLGVSGDADAPFFAFRASIMCGATSYTTIVLLLRSRCFLRKITINPHREHSLTPFC